MAIKIIAEVGECFNGNFDTALTMIEEAKKAGCDVVKFQLLDMDEVADDDPEYDWFASLDLYPERIDKLIKHAKDNGIEILFTPVSIKTAQWIKDAGQKWVKIASSFVRKTELLEFINDNFEEVIVSTGMAELNEVEAVIKLLNKPAKVSVLHCISEYPTGPLLDERGLCALAEKDVHLNMMKILKDRYPDMEIGYSDHTDDIWAPIAAAAAGADIIEKHFTMDRQTPIDHYNNGDVYMGTDHVLSIEPDKLKEMVEGIRRMEMILGPIEWQRTEGEIILRNFLRERYQQR